MNKLIKMSDYVLLPFIEKVSKEELELIDPADYAHKDGLLTIAYARFLQRALKLEMFVPCDEEGNVLEYVSKGDGKKYQKGNLKDFNKAKEKVLFEGFDISDFKFTDKGVMMNSKKWKSVWMLKGTTIEGMVYTKANLTPSAIKQLRTQITVFRENHAQITIIHSK